MSPRIAAVELIPWNLPMRRPFVTAHGSKKVSHNLRVVVHLENGTHGYGEASESLAWPDEKRADFTRALLNVNLAGKEIQAARRLSEKVWQTAGRHPAAAAALECALLDAYTRSRGVSLWKWFGGKKRSVTTSLTISAWPPRVAGQAARQAARRGFRRLKVKLTGKAPDADLDRVLAVHRAAPKAMLWLDGNQGFTREGAIRFCSRVRERRLPVELFEQPVPRGEWRGFREIERQGKIPVVADESARTVSDARRIIRKQAASVINVKLAKCGVAGALEIIRLAKKTGTRLMIGCMAESAAGLWPSVALACGTGAFHYIDLDSHLLVISPPGPIDFETRGGRLSVKNRT
ncbi:MAG: enolase C-terminal domain-like protein [Candidatus Omnitrophota bacterium]|nr:enolase C-terminal domain-like protein [Candidatus Omnitrophota bacterium]